jgi:hypothetical protein
MSLEQLFILQCLVEPFNLLSCLRDFELQGSAVHEKNLHFDGRRTSWFSGNQTVLLFAGAKPCRGF